ncbi:MAG TPA: HEAT repeat domain-containing protein [Blastocatellia bacterium]|nr:HEAT repeat domain-containing protein [Blastocatellia bacterium]
MLPFLLVVLIVVAIVWWAANRRNLTRNERLYLRRRGYAPALAERLDTGPPANRDARLLDLIRSLGDVTPYSRQRAAEELARMCAEGRRDERMLPALIAALEEDADASVRAAAALALGNLGDVRAIDALNRAVQEDESLHARAAATRALKALGPETRDDLRAQAAADQ